MAPPPSLTFDSASVARQALRAGMRGRRRALSAAQREHAAREVARRALRDSALLAGLPAGARIGVYLTHGSELDTGPLIEIARRRGWRLYVPVLARGRASGMAFAPLEGPMRPNRHGILEPVRSRGRVHPRWLRVVLVPLVAFGPDGQRLGSGAGYYDRAFAFLRRARRSRPRLVGLAYESQRLDTLESQPWDVPLDAVVTESATHVFRPR